MTFDEGRMRTWRFPRRSALTMLFCTLYQHILRAQKHEALTKQSLRTETRTMVGEQQRREVRDYEGQKVSQLEHARPSVVLQKARVKTSTLKGS